MSFNLLNALTLTPIFANSILLLNEEHLADELRLAGLEVRV
jgi:hypothetical protein